MPPRDRNEPRFDPPAVVPSWALRELIRSRRGHLSARQRTDGGHVLVARWTWSRRRTRWPSFAIVGPSLAVAALGVTLVLVVLDRHRSTAMSYVVEGGRATNGGTIDPEPSREPRVRFSDGTQVVLAAGTRAAVRSIDDRGARVALDEGRVHADVVHLPGSHWRFDAGPFQVAVTGTAFSVNWSPREQRFDIRMERGSVQVSSPLSDEAISLRAGQHLIVRVRERETIVRDGDDAEAPAPAAGIAGPSVAPAEPATEAAAAPRLDDADARASTPVGARSLARSASAFGVERGWAATLARGEAAPIVEQAERIGIDVCVAQAPLRDLGALADAARYGRRGDVARRALIALRRRFPATAAARDAAFLLGRLDEAEGDPRAAIGWYDRYLAENPAGTYLSEALGRKMTLVQRLDGDERARLLAEQYLSRFPQGVYAAAARSLRPTP